MKKKIEINLSAAWVRSRRKDEVLPADALAKFLSDTFGKEASVTGDGVSCVSLEFDDAVLAASDVESSVSGFFSSEYDECKKDGVYSLFSSDENVSEENGEELGGKSGNDEKNEDEKTASEENGESEDSEDESSDGEEADDEKEGEGKDEKADFTKKIFDGFMSSFGKKKTAREKDEGEEEETDDEKAGGEKTDGEKKSESRDEEKKPAYRFQKSLDAKVGWREFKSLVKELTLVAPELKKNKCEEAVLNRGYLFSVDDGCGISSAFFTLCSVYSELGILPLGKGSAREIRLEKPRSNNEPPFAKYEATIAETLGESDGEPRAFCLDISEWMDSIDSSDFRKFLSNVGGIMGRNLLVFRIPFVNKEILLKTEKSLNDMFSFRTVSFEPLSNEENKAVAEKEFSRCGFTVARGAWQKFFDKVAEEKSDGRYYGVKTINKIAYDVLYNKNLYNAKHGKSDKTIGKRDFASVCTAEPASSGSGMQMLDELVGEKLKDRIKEIVNQIEFARSSSDGELPCIHMRFVGNPGTGKTTVARIIGRILKEKGLLRLGNFYEYAGRDLCGQYIGSTAPKTAGICRDAYGSVLFIDEAYSLYSEYTGTNDYGREALDTLIAEMENHRDDLLVIMAGYTDEMDKLMEGNAGLKSRMPYTVEFPNFTREQLYDIFRSMVNKTFGCDDKLLPAAKEFFDSIPDRVLESKEFSNARFVRNLYERVWAKAALRVQLAHQKTLVLTKDDFDRSICEKDFSFDEKKKNRIGFV